MLLEGQKERETKGKLKGLLWPVKKPVREKEIYNGSTGLSIRGTSTD